MNTFKISKKEGINHKWAKTVQVNNGENAKNAAALLQQFNMEVFLKIVNAEMTFLKA